MPARSRHAVSFDPSVLASLACPACHGGVALVEGSLVCQTCARVYPIVDGIPILITERAVPAGS